MKLYISVLNCVSCVAVVLLHTNGIFWSHPSGELWISANFIETYFYWAVPIFFMISGATLMDYRERYTTAEFYKNRIKDSSSIRVLEFDFRNVYGIYFRSSDGLEYYSYNR